MKGRPLTYKKAGVSLTEGYRLVNLIKPPVRSTFRKEVLGDIGGFGAFFSGKFNGLANPVLVSSTDGVGTKLIVAFKADNHSTIGVDLVAMSVNDILTSGAEPLFFLDYIATGRLDALKTAAIIKGIARGCKEAGCALIGGETAEMPGVYRPGEYDLAGFAVGVVDKRKIIDGKKISAGDRLIGLASSGLHSNGFSLARKAVFDRLGFSVKSRPHGFRGRDIGAVLLTPTRIYVRPVLQVVKKFNVRGIVHITGGSFGENIPRVLPRGKKAVLNKGAWPVPRIFSLIQTGGPVKESEMLKVFNCGIGMVLVVKRRDADSVVKSFKALGEEAFIIGEVAKRRSGESAVEFKGPPIFGKP